MNNEAENYFQNKYMTFECGCTLVRKCQSHNPELRDEIERLRAGIGELRGYGERISDGLLCRKCDELLKGGRKR